MEQRIVSGVAVEHAGGRWRVERPLGADAVLLRNEAGELVSVDPAKISFPDDVALSLPRDPKNELHYTNAEWSEAARRHDMLTGLASLPRRGRIDVDHVAKELGLKRRHIFSLLRQAQAGFGIEAFLPTRGKLRAKRLDAAIEAIITNGIEQHYAKANRPSLSGLSEEIGKRCRIAGLREPSYGAIQARVHATDQAWLARRRQGPVAARSLRLLTGAHPGATAPWQLVQIDSTPCDIRLVREDDRTVIGRPTVTFAPHRDLRARHLQSRDPRLLGLTRGRLDADGRDLPRARLPSEG